MTPEIRAILERFFKYARNEERHAASKKVRSGPRSDVVLPFGGWRGELGVDWRRAKDLFGVGRGARRR